MKKFNPDLNGPIYRRGILEGVEGLSAEFNRSFSHLPPVLRAEAYSRIVLGKFDGYFEHN